MAGVATVDVDLRPPPEAAPEPDLEAAPARGERASRPPLAGRRDTLVGRQRPAPRKGLHAADREGDRRRALDRDEARATARRACEAPDRGAARCGPGIIRSTEGKMGRGLRAPGPAPDLVIAACEGAPVVGR